MGLIIIEDMTLRIISANLRDLNVIGTAFRAKENNTNGYHIIWLKVCVNSLNYLYADCLLGKISSKEFNINVKTPTKGRRPIASAISLPASAHSLIFEEDTVESLYEEVKYFVLGSHLFWCCWAIHQSVHSDLPFDYMAYAAKRLEG